MKRFCLFLLVAFVASPVLADDHKHKDHDRDWDRDHRRHSFFFHRPVVGVSVYRSPSYYEYEPAPRVYYRSSSSSIAFDVQEALARRGYYRGPIDGDIGPGSRGAIRAYQYDHGLAPTGRIDRSLLDALRL